MGLLVAQTFSKFELHNTTINKKSQEKSSLYRKLNPLKLLSGFNNFTTLKV
jgi:hypothetical protein